MILRWFWVLTWVAQFARGFEWWFDLPAGLVLWLWCVILGWLRFGLWGCFMARLVSSVFLFGVLLLSGICGALWWYLL